MNTGTILIVDDNKGVLASPRTSARKLLQQDTDSFESKSDHRPADNARRIDVVILDMNFSAGINNGNEGLYWLGAHPADGSHPTRSDADRLRRCGTCR